MTDFDLINVENKEQMTTNVLSPVIKVIGIGGGGGNAVRHMIERGVDVEFICANTDAQALQNIPGSTILQLGVNITRGLGAGTDPEVGKKAALEDRDLLRDLLKDTDMLFITTGLGGGTGTGATPVIAEIAKELGILTIAIVSTPFSFEGSRRLSLAEENGIKVLEDLVDTLIPIPNDKIYSLLPDNDKDVTIAECFSKVDDILCEAVRSFSDVIQRPGFINVDFADIRKIMKGKGLALIGSGAATGNNRALEAARMAIENPLLDHMKLKGADGILVSITANDKLGMRELDKIAKFINEFASNDVEIKYGIAADNELGEELKIMIVATGVGIKDKKPESLRLLKTSNARHSTRTVDGVRENNRFGTKKTGLDDDMKILNVPTWLRNQAD